MLKKQLFIVAAFMFSTVVSNAQIEVAHISYKEFKEVGFGAFLNFSFPVSDANYLTLEGGLQSFKNRDEEGLVVVPILAGYRYTFDKSGTGFYIEPNAGYSIGGSDIVRYDEAGNFILDENNNYTYENPSGIMAGVGLGYLLQPGGSLQFNFGLRYERIFSKSPANIISLRVSHAFTFGRRN